MYPERTPNCRKPNSSHDPWNLQRTNLEQTAFTQHESFGHKVRKGSQTGPLVQGKTKGKEVGKGTGISRSNCGRDLVEQRRESVCAVRHVFLVAHELLDRLLESIAVLPAQTRSLLVGRHTSTRLTV